jgi:hypothetical protein
VLLAVCQVPVLCGLGARRLQVRLPVWIGVASLRALEVALHFALLVRRALVREAYARRHLQRVEPRVVQGVAPCLEVVPAAERANLVVDVWRVRRPRRVIVPRRRALEENSHLLVRLWGRPLVSEAECAELQALQRRLLQRVVATCDVVAAAQRAHFVRKRWQHAHPVLWTLCDHSTALARPAFAHQASPSPLVTPPCQNSQLRGTAESDSPTSQTRQRESPCACACNKYSRPSLQVLSGHT